MKKIIKGKLYDTDTSKFLANYDNGFGYSNFRWVTECLYQKKTGEFFLHGQGGAASKYAKSVDLNSWEEGERIMPMSYAEAREWAEEYLDGDEYIKIFGAPEEDDSRKAVTLSLSVTAINAAKQAAAKENIGLSAYVERLILGK